MSKSPIKRMQEAKLRSYTSRGNTVYPRRETWQTWNQVRWRQECTVTLATGQVVEVACRGGSGGDSTTEAYAIFRGRRYWVSFPECSATKESMRRLAVAFADRVAKAAKEAKDGRA